MTDYIKHPQITEKAVDKMDFQNKLVYICYPEARKPEIAGEVEEQFDVTVKGISTMVTTRGDKKAEVQLTEDHDAQEIASRIGVF